VHDGLVTIFLCGDVMLGRGVDQILPHPGDPQLRERWVDDARRYVELAEAANGLIPYPVDFSWPWGMALQTLADIHPDARIINLETSVTTSDEFAPGKGVHYRMNPPNLPCLSAAAPDVCVLANNHVLDFGRRGLLETLDVLSGAGLRAAGAGRDIASAQRPATVPLSDGRRLLVFALGFASSGIPPSWAATPTRSGVNFEPGGSLIEQIGAVRQSGDRVVVSVHWGSNWGHDVPGDQIRFAHDLIEGGVDVVHGHSSHHPRGIEIYHGKLILYGCGDFIDDYEGIGGHERYRPDLRLQYYSTLAADSGTLIDLRMVPMQARRMRLEIAARRDTEWLWASITGASRDFGTHLRLGGDDTLLLDQPL
jgi:poly-gamma-glutamate capsule biosynthesis protein CapA/YwtB (metallophosphatase superfamily)